MVLHVPFIGIKWDCNSHGSLADTDLGRLCDRGGGESILTSAPATSL